jgi:hypothetical protein
MCGFHGTFNIRLLRHLLKNTARFKFKVLAPLLHNVTFEMCPIVAAASTWRDNCNDDPCAFGRSSTYFCADRPRPCGDLGISIFGEGGVRRLRRMLIQSRTADIQLVA